MKKKSTSEKLAKYISKIKYEELQTKTIEKVKLCILDLFGSHFAGYQLKDCNPVKKYILSLKSERQATVWSLGLKTSFTEAAFANSAISHVTVFDDMHGNTSSHYGSIVIPTAFAVGEYIPKCSGKDLICAIVCGYETGIRVGTSMMPSNFAKTGFRPSGTFGVFASAVTTGKLFKFDNKQLVNTLGLSANFGIGLMAFVYEGTTDLMFHNGLACRNGILSSILVKNGTKSPKYIFESEGGFCKTYGGKEEDIKLLVDNLDNKYKIEEVYFKPISACAFVQSAAVAALEIANIDNFNVDQISKIKVRIFSHGKNYPGLDCRGPFVGVMQAQMSNPFTIASILIKKSISFNDYKKYNDPKVYALAKKIDIIEDKIAQKKWPLEQIVNIEVLLKDGTKYRAVSKNPHFLDDSEVVNKCRSNLGAAIGLNACEKFIETVMSIEKVKEINKLTKIISDSIEK